MEDLNKQYKRNENVVSRKINNETILVPIKNNVADMGLIYGLNEVGGFVWDYLDGTNRLIDIKEMVMEQFDVSSEEAEQDLCDFVNQLKEVDAIE